MRRFLDSATLCQPLNCVTQCPILPLPMPIGGSPVLVIILKMLKQGSNSGLRLLPVLLNSAAERFTDSVHNDFIYQHHPGGCEYEYGHVFTYQYHSFIITSTGEQSIAFQVRRCECDRQQST